jgi:hypothetical protein
VVRRRQQGWREVFDVVASIFVVSLRRSNGTTGSPRLPRINRRSIVSSSRGRSACFCRARRIRYHRCSQRESRRAGRCREHRPQPCWQLRSTADSRHASRSSYQAQARPRMRSPAEADDEYQQPTLGLVALPVVLWGKSTTRRRDSLRIVQAPSSRMPTLQFLAAVPDPFPSAHGLSTLQIMAVPSVMRWR